MGSNPNNLGVRVEVYDRTTGEVLAHEQEDLECLTEDQIQVQAANLAYGLVEELWGVVEDDDDA